MAQPPQLSTATLELFHMLFGKNMEPVVHSLVLQHIALVEPAPAAAVPRARVFDDEINRLELARANVMCAHLARLLHVVPSQLRTAESEESYQSYFSYARIKACAVSSLSPAQSTPRWLSDCGCARAGAAHLPSSPKLVRVRRLCGVLQTCSPRSWRPTTTLSPILRRHTAQGESAFVSVLLRRLSRCLEQPYNVNLMVTGILAQIVQVAARMIRAGSHSAAAALPGGHAAVPRRGAVAADRPRAAIGPVSLAHRAIDDRAVGGVAAGGRADGAQRAAAAPAHARAAARVRITATAWHVVTHDSNEPLDDEDDAAVLLHSVILLEEFAKVGSCVSPHAQTARRSCRR